MIESRHQAGGRIRDYLPSPVIDGPDPRYPGAPFHDGRGVAAVWLDGVWTPLWYTVQVEMSRDDQQFINLLLLWPWAVGLPWLWHRVRGIRDDRHRLLVVRARRYGFSIFRARGMECFDTAEEAERRRVEIVRDWGTVDWASGPVIGPSERRRVRRETLRRDHPSGSYVEPRDPDDDRREPAVHALSAVLVWAAILFNIPIAIRGRIWGSDLLGLVFLAMVLGAPGALILVLSQFARHSKNSRSGCAAC